MEPFAANDDDQTLYRARRLLWPSLIGAVLTAIAAFLVIDFVSEEKEVEVWRWEYFDAVRGKRFKTRQHMTEAEAASYPGAVKLEWSREVRSFVGRNYGLPQKSSPDDSGNATGQS